MTFVYFSKHFCLMLEQLIKKRYNVEVIIIYGAFLKLKGNAVECRNSPRYCIWFESCRDCHWRNVIIHSTAEGMILIGMRHLSEKTAGSKLTISQETCHR